jgi:excisionase family DNA binding protein
MRIDEPSFPEKKPPTSAKAYSENRLLVGRHEAARMLSISLRSLDYLIANKELHTRRIGTRVLISVVELQRYARADHPQRIAS